MQYNIRTGQQYLNPKSNVIEILGIYIDKELQTWVQLKNWDNGRTASYKIEFVKAMIDDKSMKLI